MKARLFSILCAAFTLLAPALHAGTWADHFSTATLLPDWTGNREAFRTTTNNVLDGESGSPLGESPFHYIEIQTDSTDATVTAWINVVMPNTRVCTKGALLLRHTGAEAYVFALHEATQTAEVYRLSNHQMLITKPWKIDLRAWYHVRAELHGPTMTFYIDGQQVGTLTDSASPSGAVGLAVQDADSALFDDFEITGPNVIGNIDNVTKPSVTTTTTATGEVTLRFNAESPYDYFVQVANFATPSHDWQTIATFTAKLDLGEVTVTDPTTNGIKFYRVEKVPCYCR